MKDHLPAHLEPYMPRWYLLDDKGNPYRTEDLRAAEELLCNVGKRRVGGMEKEINGHKVWLSTVFLVLEHLDWSMSPPRPALFETMLFIDDNEIGSATGRYATRDEALAGHNEIMEKVQQLLMQLGEHNIKTTDIAGLLGEHYG